MDDSFPLSTHIQRVTELMLRIEQKLHEKSLMVKKLNEKRMKWEQKDAKSKQRRIMLNYTVRLNMMSSFDYNAYM
jgi:hypothetical protein